MKIYLSNALKFLLMIVLFFLISNTSNLDVGVSLLMIGFLISIILNPILALAVFPVLYFSFDLRMIIIFIVAYGLGVTLKVFYCKNKLYALIFLSLTTILSNVLYGVLYNKDILILLISSFMIIALYGSFLYTTDIYVIDNRTEIKIKKYQFLSSIFILLMSLGSLNLEYGLIFICSFSLSVILMIFFKGVTSKILPILSIVFLYPQFGFLVSFLYIIFNLFYLTIDPLILFYFEIVILIVGTFMLLMKKNSPIHPKRNFSIYENLSANFNDQILKFASFLDEFKKTFINNTDSSSKLSEAFGIIINTFCQTCPKKKECLLEKKNETYLFIRNALIYGNDIHVLKSTSDMKEIIKYCHYSSEIINRAHSLRNKYSLSDLKNPKEKNLESQINGLAI